MKNKTRPLLTWAGGKTRLLSKLLPHIPPASGYIEVFGGGAALLLAKSPSKFEVYNDLRGDVVNLYKVAKYHPDALVAEFLDMPCSREFLKQTQDVVGSLAMTDIQRAAIFLHNNKCSFGGNGYSFPVSRVPATPVPSKEYLAKLVHDFSERMGRVLIENLDYRRIFRNYDHPRNFMFLDPPYYKANAPQYAGWNEDEMREFAEHVSKLESRWIITVDDSTLNRELWKDHFMESVSTRNGIGNQAAGIRFFGELIIHSHEPSKQDLQAA